MYINYNKDRHTAIDTETIDGKVILICSPNRYKVFPQTFEEIATFLITEGNNGHNIWTFNLTYDASAILKFIPFENLKEIYETNKTEYNNYNIFFIPNKLFSISIKGHKCTLVDAMQFFQSSLDKAGETFLNERKMDNPIIEEFKNQEDKISEELKEYFIKNKDILIQYCKQDALLTAKLGKLIDDSCFSTYGFRLNTYSSNAKIGEKATLEYCGYINKNKGNRYAYPQIFLDSDGNTKSKPLMFAQMSVRGGIFETWQRGTFDESTDLDINSAYPDGMRYLPHWANGSFEELNDEQIDDLNNGNFDIKYGWLGCEFDCSYIPYDTELPETFKLIYEGKEIEVEANYHKIYFPNGLREQVITHEEFKFMKEYGFKVKALCGYYWQQNKITYKNPFGWIEKIYDKKTQIKKSKGKEAKKDMNYLQCKIGMNGSYGKTVQKIGFNRVLYNPFYGSYITAMCRTKISRFILDNKLEDRVINIATDGILLDGEYNYHSGEGLGEWDINYYDNALVLGNGMLMLEGEKGISSRLRGITNKQDIDIRKLFERTDKENKFEIDLSKGSKAIYEDNVFKFEKRRPLKLGEMIMHNIVFKPEQFNTFIKFGRKLEINADTKRAWKELNSFSELLNNNYKGESWTIKQIEEMKNKEVE